MAVTQPTSLDLTSKSQDDKTRHQSEAWPQSFCGASHFVQLRTTEVGGVVLCPPLRHVVQPLEIGDISRLVWSACLSAHMDGVCGMLPLAYLGAATKHQQPSPCNLSTAETNGFDDMTLGWLVGASRSTSHCACGLCRPQRAKSSRTILRELLFGLSGLQV